MREILRSFNLLTASEIDLLLSHTRERTLKKGDLLIRVQSGMLRVFYHNSAGDDITACFIFENAFAASYTSFITQTPGIENIEALTEVTLLTVPADIIFSLERGSTNWANFSKIIAQQELCSLRSVCNFY